jgi:hypothetical protein
MENGVVSASRVTTVMRMMVDAYGGQDVGQGSARAKSSISSDALTITEELESARRCVRVVGVRCAGRKRAERVASGGSRRTCRRERESIGVLGAGVKAGALSNGLASGSSTQRRHGSHMKSVEHNMQRV